MYIRKDEFNIRIKNNFKFNNINYSFDMHVFE